MVGTEGRWGAAVACGGLSEGGGGDAALVAAAVLAGGSKRIKRALDRFRERQTATVLQAELP